MRLSILAVLAIALLPTASSARLALIGIVSAEEWKLSKLLPRRPQLGTNRAEAEPIHDTEAPRRTAELAPSAADFPNPERGFYRAAPGTLDALEQSWLDRVFAEGVRLVYARIDLSSYRDRSLPPALLAGYERGFATARRAGVKLIVRAVYNYPAGETEYRSAQDAPLRIVQEHLTQLGPVMAANIDTIGFIQAGFIGAWGEWHTSSNGLTQPAARTAIRDALIVAMPAERAVQFRYPADLASWMSAAASAFPRGRIGFHNDCFLASQTDVGTFPEHPAERKRLQAAMARLTERAPFGGETCNPADDPAAEPRTGCADILGEGARFHLTYLNADYYRRLFHERWQSGGCMDQVQRSMGYRLTLRSVQVPVSVARGESLNIEAIIENSGWANVINRRALEMVLIEKNGSHAHRMSAPDVDVSDWLSGTTNHVVSSIVVPHTVPAGLYRIALALPDPSARLRADGRYAIRFANADSPGNYWDTTNHAFVTEREIMVR